MERSECSGGCRIACRRLDSNLMNDAPRGKWFFLVVLTSFITYYVYAIFQLGPL
jgi:hypothetical protein